MTMFLSREDYDEFLAAQEDDREANRFDATPHMDSRGVPALAQHAPEPASAEPAPWTWAATARMMAQSFPDDGFDWDRWKDEMKEAM